LCELFFADFIENLRDRSFEVIPVFTIEVDQMFFGSLNLEIPRLFMDEDLSLVRTEVVGLKSGQVCNLGETGCSDWEERKPSEGSAPTAFPLNGLHDAIEPRVRHQAMLVHVNAAGESLCQLIIIWDASTAHGFRDRVERNTQLRDHGGRSAYIDTKIFPTYLREVLIAHIELSRSQRQMPDSSAVLFMDNCSAHMSPTVIELHAPSLKHLAL
jgi:hypothetical protein